MPACLALAQCLSGQSSTEGAWFRLSRPFIILAWLFPTAGIVLGAWWAYMSWLGAATGHGTRWKMPRLFRGWIATASLHTLIVEDRAGGKLGASMCP